MEEERKWSIGEGEYLNHFCNENLVIIGIKFRDSISHSTSPDASISSEGYQIY